jgi:UDP:flavonoid glycosyltransferase YjiC (YdhE family)
MKILVAGWDSGGGMEAVQTVVGRAVARGHQVRVLGTEGLRSRFESAGAAFRRYKYAPDNDLRQPETDLVKDWEAGNPLSQWQRVRDRLLCGPAREFCRDVAEELQRDAADVAVVDTMIPSALFGAEVAGVPGVILMHGPYMIPRAEVPPIGSGCMPASGSLGRLRDRSAAAVTLAVFRSGMPTLNRARAEFGLAPVRDLPDLMGRADRILVCSSPSYDFGSGSVPVNVCYVGPQLDDDASGAVDDSWAGPSGRPLVLVGLSSTVMRQEGLLQRPPTRSGRPGCAGLSPPARR